MKILLLSDSLSLPRRDGETRITYEETYYARLRCRDDAYLDRLSYGHATSTDIVRQLRYWEGFDPDLVLLNFGINDCMPRALLYHEKAFLTHYAKLGYVVNKVINRYKTPLRRLRKATYVPLPQFKTNLAAIQTRFAPARTIACPIIGAPAALAKFPSGLETTLHAYNDAFRTHCDHYLDLDLTADDYMPDGFHFSAQGHAKVHDALIPLLES